MTEVNFDEISSYQRYKLMASLIVPRPIALVTTLGHNGVVNAAPFSMFNMIGEDPPILMLSINRLSDGRLKDTAANILANGEFVVHMSDEPMAQQMHACGEAFPSDVSELVATGLTPVPSHCVAPPRIVDGSEHLWRHPGMLEFNVQLHTALSRQVKHGREFRDTLATDVEHAHLGHVELVNRTILTLPATGGVIMEHGQFAIGGQAYIQLTHLGTHVHSQVKRFKGVLGGVG